MCAKKEISITSMTEGKTEFVSTLKTSHGYSRGIDADGSVVLGYAGCPDLEALSRPQSHFVCIHAMLSVPQPPTAKMRGVNRLVQMVLSDVRSRGQDFPWHFRRAFSLSWKVKRTLPPHHPSKG